MAFLGLKVPPETARLLSEIECDGKKEAPSSYHITLLFLGSEVPIETLAKALVTTYNITSQTRPFTVSTNRVCCFPKNEDGVPVICRVDSDPLYDLQAQLAKAYDDAGIEYSKKYEYKAHLTLAYGETEIEEKRIPKLEWGAHEIVLWGGDTGDNRVVMHFPFSLDTTPQPQELVARVAERFKEEGPISTMPPPAPPSSQPLEGSPP